MTEERVAYVVESKVESSNGGPTGTARVWVATEKRAQEIRDQLPQERTYRPVPWSQLPEKVRANFERAEAGAPKPS